MDRSLSQLGRVHAGGGRGRSRRGSQGREGTRGGSSWSYGDLEMELEIARSCRIGCFEMYVVRSFHCSSSVERVWLRGGKEGRSWGWKEVLELSSVSSDSCEVFLDFPVQPHG